MPVSFHRNQFQPNYPNGISSSSSIQQQQHRQIQLTLFTSNNDNNNNKRHDWIDKMKKDEREESHTTKKNKNSNADCYVVGSSGDRRTFFQSLGLASIIWTTTTPKDPVNARGLVQVPCNYDLANTYHFLRAGQSLLEEEDILSTNPLFLTNREAALSELGRTQVEKASQQLVDDGIQLTILRYSLAAAAVDSANIVGNILKVGRDSIVPEFNYMDPRAVGKWDMLPLQATEEAIWAMDNDEAGPNGLNGRPPANEDSTPHETLADQVTRLRQLISVLETQYSGDTILLVFPDGTGPALLECLIAGIPLNKVHEMNYASGELRRDITYNNVRKRMPSSEVSEEYAERLARGRKELVVLRKDPDKIINVKDQQDAEDQRLYAEKKARLDALKEKQELEKETQKQNLRQQMKKEREEVVKSNDGTNVDSNVMVAGVGLVAVGGGAVLITNKDSDDTQSHMSMEDKNQTAETPDPMKTNSTELISSNEDLNVIKRNATEEISPSNSLDSDVLQVPNIPDKSKNEKSDTLESKSKLKEVTKSTEIERPKGMYLDIDEEDGGDAWLNVLSDILLEAEIENEKDKKPNGADL